MARRYQTCTCSSVLEIFIVDSRDIVNTGGEDEDSRCSARLEERSGPCPGTDDTGSDQTRRDATHQPLPLDSAELCTEIPDHTAGGTEGYGSPTARRAELFRGGRGVGGVPGLEARHSACQRFAPHLARRRPVM